MRQAPRGRPFQPGQSGNPGGRPAIVGELRELARAHAPEAIAELARLAKDAKSETARIAAIKELLDRGYGKPTQFVAAENDEPALNDLNLEELRASMLADFERVFPEYRLVTKPRSASRSTRTCSGMPAATRWPIRASIPERSRPIWATAQSIRPHAMRRWPRVGSKTSGARDSDDAWGAAPPVTLTEYTRPG